MFEKFKVICFVFFLHFSLQASEQSTRAIEIMGDIFQFLPAFGGGYALYLQDNQGLKEFAIGFGTTMGIVVLSKTLLQKLGKKSPHAVYFAKRPKGGNFEGFPSGHTASAFSAVGFLQKRYGWQFSLPALILATFTGYSRIKAQKHTTLQVITGAMLGFTTSYLSASKWINPQQESITFAIDQKRYILQYSRLF